jgi:hypothetical protein
MRLIAKIALIIGIHFYTACAFCQQWYDVAGGADDYVTCFYNDTTSNLLYVSGSFDHLGVNTIHQIATWNGNNWSPIGTNEIFSKNSLPATVNAIILYNGDLIAGGVFDSVEGVLVNNIARWDGAHWNKMGDGFDERVYVLQVYNGELYAGGEFHSSGNDTVYYISKWTGTQWVSLGQGWGVDNSVTSMTVFDNKLILGGYFGSIYGSTITGRVLGWDGSDWLSMNGAFNYGVIVVKKINDTLYAGGEFTGIGSNNNNYISKWDGVAWLPMPYPIGGPQPWVTDIVSYETNLYVCGYFTSPPGIGRLNGANYDSVGNVLGYLKTMTVYNNELYVAGTFSHINGLPLYNIARYSIVNEVNEEFSVEDIPLAYPNPIRNEQELHIILNDFSSNSIIKLYDNHGRFIHRYYHNSIESKIKISQTYSKGMYYINIIGKNKKLHTIPLIIN